MTPINSLEIFFIIGQIFTILTLFFVSDLVRMSVNTIKKVFTKSLHLNTGKLDDKDFPSYTRI